jgi:formylglycine-generating enzyme required for sulfatase activity
MRRSWVAAVLTLSLCPFITLSLAQAPTRDITATEKRVALVIGNSRYAVGPLNNPGNDAKAITGLLQSLGFEVLSHTDLDLVGMRRALADFGERMAEGGVALFYYSGHGLQVGGKNYLIPLRARLTSERYIAAETVEVDAVLKEMDAARNRLNVVILDACRDNPFARGWRTAARGLAQISGPPGTLIAYATDPGDVAADGEPGTHGVYTGELLRALPEPGLKIEDTFKRTARGVIDRTRGRQRPWFLSSFTGDFAFVVPAERGPGDRVAAGQSLSAPLPPSPPAPQQVSPLPPIALVPPPQPPRPVTGFLVFQGRPTGTAVILDGRSVGTVGQTPLRLEANVGIYALRLEASGHKPRETQIEVKANTEQPIQFELERIIEALRAGTIQRRGKDNAEMVYIPGGTFTMGDTHGDGDWDEKPTHQVTVADFWLDRTETANAQFARFVQASTYQPQGERQKEAPGKDQHPVVNVTWNDAVAYCRWADKRLPTEAEWEYAARGTDGRKYPWGNAWEDNRARFARNRGNQTTAPVGSYPSGASPFGVLDLTGNVWEWVSSLYKPYPYSATDGREDLNASGGRVNRGGSWSSNPGVLRSADRGGFVPSYRYYVLGFRCAQDVPRQ